MEIYRKTRIGSYIPLATNGSVLFIDGGSVLAQDNANFFYDYTNHRLGIGTTSPSGQIEIKRTDAGITTFFVTNTGTGDVNYTMQVANSGGNAYSKYLITGVSNFFQGIKNSDRAYYIAGTTFGGGRDFFKINQNGGVTINTEYSDQVNLTLKARAAQANDFLKYTDSSNNILAGTDAAGNRYNYDSIKNFFGTGKDMSVYYDGTDGWVKTNEVAASDLKVSCGTDKTIELQESVWNDINFEALNLRLGATAPTFINILGSGGIYGYGFDGATLVEEMHGGTEILHDYKQGTDLSLHFHWMPVNTNSGDVKWQLEYSWANVDGTYSAPTIVSVTDSADGVAWKNQKTSEVTISGTGKVIGSHIVFRIFRDPTDVADTYASDAVLLSVGVHYETDTIGSRQMLTK